jgi:hypothetical protein
LALAEHEVQLKTIKGQAVQTLFLVQLQPREAAQGELLRGRLLLYRVVLVVEKVRQELVLEPLAWLVKVLLVVLGLIPQQQQVVEGEQVLLGKMHFHL